MTLGTNYLDAIKALQRARFARQVTSVQALYGEIASEPDRLAIFSQSTVDFEEDRSYSKKRIGYRDLPATNIEIIEDSSAVWARSRRMRKAQWLKGPAMPRRGAFDIDGLTFGDDPDGIRVVFRGEQMTLFSSPLSAPMSSLPGLFDTSAIGEIDPHVSGQFIILVDDDARLRRVQINANAVQRNLPMHIDNVDDLLAWEIERAATADPKVPTAVNIDTVYDRTATNSSLPHRPTSSANRVQMLTVMP